MAPEKKLRVGLTVPVVDLDPRRAQDLRSAVAIGQIFDPPYRTQSRGKRPAPLVFSEELTYEGRDKQVCSAPVRDDLHFSDGTSVTATRVAESLNQAPGIRLRAKVRAESERVIFELSRPGSYFDLLLTHYGCGIFLEKNGELLGCGPYRVGSREPLRLVRNPHYSPQPAIEAIDFVVHPAEEDGHPKALIEALSRDEIDFSMELSRHDAASLKGIRKWFEPGISTGLLYINTESVDSREVRRALGHAIDRHQITELSFDNPLAFTASSLLPPGLGRANDRLSHNLKKAKRLLQTAPEVPSHLNLLVIWAARPYLPRPRATAQKLAEQIGALGIHVRVEHARSGADYYTRVGKGAYDLLLAGWMADTADPAEFIDALLSSRNILTPEKTTPNSANHGRLRSDETDRALEILQQEGSKQSLDAVLKLAASEVPFVPLMYGPTVIVHSWRLKNYRLSPLGLPILANLDLQ